jgi:hypothetical protein
MSISPTSKWGHIAWGAIPWGGNVSLNPVIVVGDSINNWLDFVDSDGPKKLEVLNDSLSILDTSIIVLSLNYTLNDSNNNWLDNIVFPGAVITEVLNDSLTFLDIETDGGLQPAFLFIDSLGILDSVFLILTLPNTLNDSYTINDSIVVQNLFVINLFFSEFNNIQDNVNTQLNILLVQTFNDSLSFSDVLLLSISIPIRFGDIIPPYLDFIQKGGINSTSILTSDFLLWSDAPSMLLSKRYLFNDSKIPSDSFLYSLNSSGNAFNDSYTLNDAITISLSQPFSLSLSDSYNLSDSATTQLPEPLNTYIRRYLNDVVM